MPKTDYKKMENDLSFEKKNCWEVWNEKETKEAMNFSEGYKEFLNSAKTERQTVDFAVKLAEEHGFKNLNILKGIKAGDKVYQINKEKTLILAVIGKKLLAEGFKMVMSHVDSPHLDIKVNPLYEDENLAFLKTHYYGGIKKYHWPTIPLSLIGTVILSDGKKVKISIGEKDADPIFMITDLLPHLSQQQSKKILSEAVAGEELNIVAGSIPVKDEKIKAKVKLAILKYLNDEYGISEEDFFSADLQAAPNSKARDLGFDRSMVAAYGQDDRVCVYTSAMALFDSKISDETQICLLVDREEIGSAGATSAQSVFIENFIADLLDKTTGNSSYREVYKLMSKSFALSSDVTAAYDPDYKSVHDPLNVAKLGSGVAIEKYTGHGGKYNTSEASSEYVQKIRKILNDKKVIWQTAGLGKVDEGGGGTIAVYLAQRNIEVIDMGVALFNMHAPMEIASKADIYCAYQAYKAFYSA